MKKTILTTILFFLLFSSAIFSSRAHAVTGSSMLSLTPAAITVSPGTSFQVTVMANAQETVNAVQADLTYPTDKVSLVSIDTTTSSFSIKADESFGSGKIHIVRGSTSPLSGNAIVAKLNFASTGVLGISSVSFASTSMLVSSVTNANILAGTQGGTYTIAVPVTPTLTPSPVLPPPLTTGFQGQYFNNKTLSGTPVVVRNDSAINFNWWWGSPDSAIQSNNFSARWVSSQFFHTGKYQFSVTSDDGMRVYIDNVRVFNWWNDHSTSTKTFSRTVEEGSHTIIVEYYEHNGIATAKLSWKKV